MTYLAQPVSITRRTLFAMLALSGFSVGTIIAGLSRTLGV